MDEIVTSQGFDAEEPLSGSAGQADTTSVNLSKVDSRFVQCVPIAYARQFGVLGLQSSNGCLPVAISSSESLQALDKIAVLLGIPTHPVSADPQEIQAAINRAYGEAETGVEAVIDDLDKTDSQALLAELGRTSDLLDSAAASPVTKFVNLVLLESVKRRASDIHIQPYEDRVQVRMRIDGVLYDHVQTGRHLLDEIVSRIKVMGKMNIAEKRLAQDGRTTVKVGERVVDLRISSLPTSHGERVVLRLLDKSARLYKLQELGMNEHELKVFRRLIRRTHGIILVTGPTGSGKTTTLYAALQELDHRELNILTLEDPIEYQLPGISQTQVSLHKGMTFATGLRHVLRQDPDVIMVGEIRDEETARMAIQSSLTGHLVFSTLHTNDSAGTVARLLDLSVEPYLVAGSLLGVMAQRLMRRVCPHCRKERACNASDHQLLEISATEPMKNVFEATSCSECQNRGYCDRIGIFELLLVNDEVQDLIANRAKSREIKSAACRAGMTTLRQSAIQKLAEGLTTLEEVLRVTQSDGLGLEDE